MPGDSLARYPAVPACGGASLGLGLLPGRTSTEPSTAGAIATIDGLALDGALAPLGGADQVPGG
jgi:hypothetical protein